MESKSQALAPRRIGRGAGPQRGATLIEVLVATLVLAIGLIGLAGLQAVSLRSSLSAHVRAQATMLAADLADRARTRAKDSTSAYLDASGDADRALWNARVTAVLGTGAVGHVTNPGGSRIRIAISWSDERGCIRSGAGTCTADGGGGPSFVYETAL